MSITFNDCLKREIIAGFFLWLRKLRRRDVFDGFLVYRIWLDDNGFGRGGTWFFTGAATNTVLRIDFGIENIFLIDKINCVRWTNFSAGTAILFIYVNNTFFLYQINLSDLDQFFFFEGKGKYSSCWANLAANIAFIVAKTFPIVHQWLHHAGESVF